MVEDKKILPVALYRGMLPIGDIELDCAVLDDSSRVLMPLLKGFASIMQNNLF